MKEYLLERDGKYELHKGGIVPEGAIEVPEGAEIYLKGRDFNLFKKKVCDTTYTADHMGKWRVSVCNGLNTTNRVVLWQRTPSLNDQYAEIEKVRHAHYFKDVSDIDEIDVYEVLHRFGVTDPCLQHIVKKALCAGERGHKDFHTDLKNIADTAQRMLEIHGL